MKAIVYEKYGQPDVLHLKEVAKPIPKKNEVLIKVYATTVTPMDWRFRQGKNPIARMMAGPMKPNNPILGVELSGEVETAGKEVKLFKQGDHVYAGGCPGGHAQYVCWPEDKVSIKPANMTFEEAAGVPFCGTTALYFLKELGKIQDEQKVLINGASGGVGTFAVQLAKYFGAHVTGVCSTTNLELVQSLGADKVIDYTSEDFTTNGQTHDIIFDAVGKRSFSQCKKSLNQRGIYLSTIATFPLLIQTLWTSMIGEKKAKFSMPPCTTKELNFLKDIIEAGKMKTVIDRTYPLSDTAEAHMYSENGHAKGKLVITLEHNNKI
ncbi:NAD(P)-dependent alcohol dehydrogenase [Chloroflexota bacterium]